MVAPGGAYGDRTDMLDLQASAPMAATPATPAVEPIPFNAPTQRPDEPVTTGVAAGPGAGPEILANNQGPQVRKLTHVLQSMVANDTTGEVSAFLSMAEQNGW
jgi:hypothetical protein